MNVELIICNVSHFPGTFINDNDSMTIVTLFVLFVKGKYIKIQAGANLDKSMSFLIISWENMWFGWWVLHLRKLRLT